MQEPPFIKPIFYSRILGDTKKRMKVIEDESKSTKTAKYFRFIFEPSIKYNKEIEYCWGWGNPKMFVLEKPGSEKKEKYDDEFECIIEEFTEDFFVSAFFEGGYPLYGEPWIDIFDLYGNLIKDDSIKGKSGLTCTRRPYGMEYSRHFPTVHQNYSYKIRWQVK